MSDQTPDHLMELLLAWHAGDAQALSALVEQELPWIAARIRRRLGQFLRTRHDTQDIVQETLLSTLRDGPRFVVADRGSFRALISRIVENVIRREHEHMTAGRRDARREAPLPSRDTVLHLGGGRSPCADVSEEAATNELRAWVRLALELLSNDDREVVQLREYGGLSFAELGARLGGIQENAARMRFHRALARLGVLLDRLRSGRLRELLDELEPVPCTTPRS